MTNIFYIKFLEISIIFNQAVQSIYDMIILKFYSFSTLRALVIAWHTFLFYFRFYALQLGAFIEIYIPLNVFAICISVIASRLHFAGYLITACMLFVQLDFAVVNMLRFYKKYPVIFHTSFPLVTIAKRGMWSHAAKTVGEAASNPQVQAVGAAVAGALAWKALDVYETSKAAITAEATHIADATQQEANRVADAIQQEANRVAEAIQQEANRAAEVRQQEANRAAEADQRDLDRREENRRTAFSISVSPDFTNLSQEQQERIFEVIKSGDLK
jgi:hypothetical protein